MLRTHGEVIAIVRWRIKRARELAGLSQAELAERLSVRPITVYQWETGRRDPDVASLVRLAQVTGVAILQLTNAEDTIQIPD